MCEELGMERSIIDKPQPKPKAKAKSKAKAWAEVVYIIATCPLPCPALPLPQNSSTASTISPIELKFSGKNSTNKWSILGMKILTSPKSKSDFRPKSGGPPKISKKFNQDGMSSIFQGRPGQINDQHWVWKFWPPLSQNPTFGQKVGGTPKIIKTIQPSPIELKFSGKAKTNNWTLLMKILTPPPKAQIRCLAKSWGGGPTKSRKSQPQIIS